eukprot:TRINITY_DN11571_c0_g1_i2.p2 TRINITY_DN11571_c0_g1~~TRINITY_DN11571_c0_g1_i2.p2  ORF type:complete len:126 (+),score=7.80 TRINITY_DN11571_c0_g1_i2:291-668(+)
MERVDSVHRSPLLGDRACGCGADLLESKRQPLCRRSGSFPEISAFASKPTVELGSRCKANASLPKGSPYVGFQRHSPPSPVLGFKLPMHAVPKDPHVNEPRINLTWRWITKHNRESGCTCCGAGN